MLSEFNIWSLNPWLPDISQNLFGIQNLAWAKHENDRREAAMRAHWAANVLGRGVNMKGEICPPLVTC